MRVRYWIAALTLAFAAPCQLLAMWLPMSLSELIAQSDLIVVGKIVFVQQGAQSPSANDTATLAVERSLKGFPPGPRILLEFPGKQRGVTDGAGRFVSTRILTDVYFDLDQEGIWFLKATSTSGVYRAPHPARFKPRFFLQQVLSALNGF